MFLARGYDTISGEVRGDCVQRTDVKSTNDSTAQRTSFSLSKIETYNSLAKQVGASASASISGAIGNVSAKAQFLDSVNVNDYSIYVLARVSVLNSTATMERMSLTDSARDVVEKQGADDFRKLCGDMFVSGYTTGGELFSVLEILTHSSEEKNQISASLGGSYGVFSGAATFQQALEKVSKTNTVNVFMYRVGAGGVVKITPEELVTYATNFPAAVTGAAAYTIKATLMPYSNVPLPAHANLIDVSNQTDVIQYLSEKRLWLIQQLANIDYVVNHADEFTNPDVVQLYKFAQDVRKNLNTITVSARACYQNYSNCKFPTELDTASISLPKRQEKTPDSAAELNARTEKLKQAQEVAEKEKMAAQARERDARDKLARQEAELRQIEEQAAKAKESAVARQREAEAAQADAKRKEAEARAAQAEAERATAEAQARLAEAERQRAEAEEKKKRAEKDARDAAIIIGTGGVGAVPVIACRLFHC